MCGYLVFSALFVKKTIPYPLNGLSSLVKNPLTIDTCSVSGLYSSSLVSVSVLVPGPCRLNYHCLIGFEIVESDSFYFILLFQDCFAYPESPAIPEKF